MEIIGIILAILIVRALIKSSIKNRENEKIKAGTLVRLSNGKVKDPNSLLNYEKTLLPSYIYLSEHGSKYGYKYLTSTAMNVKELDEAMSKVKRMRREEEMEKKRREEERRREDNEKMLIEIKRKQHLQKIENIKRSIEFEINNVHNESKKAGVYMIFCVENEQFYIGSTKNMLIRKSQHLNELKNKKHHSYKLQKAFDQYGENKFKFFSLYVNQKKSLELILNPNPTEQEIEKDIRSNIKSAEQYYIDSFEPGFNVEKDVSGRRHWEYNSKYR